MSRRVTTAPTDRANRFVLALVCVAGVACSGSAGVPDGGADDDANRDTDGGVAQSVAFEWFIAGQGPESAVIAVMPMDATSAPVALTTPGEYRDWWARPSPDRSKILFERDDIGHLGSVTESIWIMDADGGNQTRIMSIAADDPHNNPNGFTSMGHAEWTVDGQSIVFSADGPSTTTYAIWTMATDGTNQQPLTSGELLSIDPSICPDGRILFVRGGIFPASFEVYIMDGDGNNQAPVSVDVDASRPEQADYDPYCSPDSTRVISLRQISLLSWNNVLQNIDGSEWTAVADGAAETTSFGVARWAAPDRIVTSRIGTGGLELVTYDPDAPAVKSVLLPADGPNRFRDPAPF